MRIIAHRANLNGPDKYKENTVNAVEACLEKGFDVEIDVQNVYGHDIFMGHDADGATERLRLPFYESFGANRLWLHAKNFEAFTKLCSIRNLYHYKHFDVFFHDRDFCALTYNRYYWIYPTSKLSLTSHKQSVMVLPELSNLEPRDFIPYTFHGICTDYPLQYKRELEKNE